MTDAQLGGAADQSETNEADIDSISAHMGETAVCRAIETRIRVERISPRILVTGDNGCLFSITRGNPYINRDLYINRAC